MSGTLVRHCDIFINVFEKQVLEYQQKINAMREMESLYNIAKQAVESWKHNNELSLVIADETIIIQIKALPTDPLSLINSLADDIQSLLVQRKLREDRAASVSFDGEGKKLIFAITNDDSVKYINIQLDIPDNGCLDYAWVTEQRKFTYTARKLIEKILIPVSDEVSK